MNIDSLTYGELKQLSATLRCMFPCAGEQSAQAAPTAGTGVHPAIGQYVIARTYAAGVHAGTVTSVDGENVTLTNSTRLWAWRAADGLALSGVAQNGIDRSKSKLDVVNSVIYLTGVCELIPCSKKAKESIHA